MSKIDTLIQTLQLKKKKLDYLVYVEDLLKGDQKCIDFLEVQEEVLAKLLPLVKSLATEIEESVESSSKPQTVGELGAEDLKNLKVLADKIKQKTNDPMSPPASPQQNPKQPNQIPVPDKMNFAMDNRHLSNKTVRVLHKETKQPFTTGTVVGLDAPNVIVKTVEGHTIGVPLENIVIGDKA